MEIHRLSERSDQFSECKNIDTTSEKEHVITDIKPAIRDQNRVNIFVNDTFDFSLDLAQVVDYKIKVGQAISQDQLESLRTAAEFGKLYQCTLEWVLTRPHSVSEVRDYLKKKQIKRQMENRQTDYNKTRTQEERKKYKLKTKKSPLISDENIDAVISRLNEKGYLDDKKFAEYYVENRSTKKGVSKRRLVLELESKGISKEDIESTLALGLRSDEEEMKKIIAKKRKKYTDDQLITYLTHQGFDFQQAKDAVLGTD